MRRRVVRQVPALLLLPLLILLKLPNAEATKKSISWNLDPSDAGSNMMISSQEMQAPGLISFDNLTFAVSSGNSYKNADDDAAYGGALVDVAIVYCGPLEDATECVMPELGVGAYTDDGTYYKCCTETALAAGICEEEGRLILSDDSFSGKLLEIELTEGYEPMTPENARYSKRISGLYIVIVANCDANNNLPVAVEGQLIFKSRYGYLPVRMWKFLWVSHVFTLMCLSSIIWFHQLRRRQAIDRLIFVTLILAFLESLLLSLYYIRYNSEGVSPEGLNSACLLLDGFKNGLGHILMVLAGFGWGHLPSDQVSKSMPIHNLFVLGVFYTIIQVIPSLSHPAAVGELFGLFFVAWSLKAATTTIGLLRGRKGEQFSRFVLLRALYLGLILLAVVLFAIYLQVSLKAQSVDKKERIRQRFLVIRQVVFLLAVVAIGVLIRPYNAPLLGDMDADGIADSYPQQEGPPPMGEMA